MDRIVGENLFEIEQEVLRSAISEAANRSDEGNELLPHYNFLIGHYAKLLKLTRKVFHISDIQGQSLQRHQAELRNLLDNANQGFLTFGPDLIVDRQYSAECSRIFGRKIAGNRITELLNQGDSSGTLQTILQNAFSCSAEQGTLVLQQFPSKFHIGEKDILVECKLIPQPGEVADSALVMMILTDETERLRAEDQIQFLSYHDKLTMLHNRAYVEKVLPELEKSEVLPLSIIMADMNGLKLANDVFGHQQGDLLLVELARALKKSCRQTDVVGRWGGDEFVILLPRTDKDSCDNICSRIHKICDEVDVGVIPLSVALGSTTKEVGVLRLTEMLSTAETKMYTDKLIKNKEGRKTIIASLEKMFLSRGLEEIGHRGRTAEMAVGFANFMGVDVGESEGNLLKQLAQLHDIGKVAIPAEILTCKRSLTAVDWDIIKSHSEIGYRIAQSIGESAVADIILALHERWDGNGYPLGLAGAQIPYWARVFAVIDVYDVITHERPYAPTMDEQKALLEIETASGSQFDPKLAQLFVEYMDKGR